MMYRTSDFLRLWDGDQTKGNETRDDYEIDYDRIIHSASFRRLDGKTQLFPGDESDFFRNRLTHSLEVAQLAKDLAIRLNTTLLKDRPEIQINPKICEIAGLLHDIGHAPFGHNGEHALDDCMKQYGGFEGNAQTLRIIMLTEKRCEEESQRYGLNLTSRAILSVLKYDEAIPRWRFRFFQKGVRKGFYKHMEKRIKEAKINVFGSEIPTKCKTIECSIMDIADDIAYSTHDYEDAMKAGFIHPLMLLCQEIETIKKIAAKVFGKKDLRCITETEMGKVGKALLYYTEPVATISESTFPEEYGHNPFPCSNYNDLANIFSHYFNKSEKVAKNSFDRTNYISLIIHEFIGSVNLKIDEKHPQVSKVFFPEEMRIKVETLKQLSYINIIESPRMKVIEHRGYTIVKSIFDELSNDKKRGYMLMPSDFQNLYKSAKTEAKKKRVVCDFIAGMTDRYALEYYARLFSEDAQTLFKPF